MTTSTAATNTTTAALAAAATESADTTTPDTKNTQDTTTGEGLPTDVDTLHTMIHQLRNEAAASKVNTKAAEEAEQSLMHKIGEALGLTTTSDKAAPTIEDLTAKVTESENARTKAEQTLTVYRAAQGIADTDMLIDSTKFNTTLDDIDLTDPKAITEAITQFVKDNPKFAPVQATGQSSIDHAPVPNGSIIFSSMCSAKLLYV